MAGTHLNGKTANSSLPFPIAFYFNASRLFFRHKIDTHFNLVTLIYSIFVFSRLIGLLLLDQRQKQFIPLYVAHYCH